MFAKCAKTVQIEQTPDKRMHQNDILHFVVRVQYSIITQNYKTILLCVSVCVWGGGGTTVLARRRVTPRAWVPPPTMNVAQNRDPPLLGDWGIPLGKGPGQWGTPILS